PRRRFKLLCRRLLRPRDGFDERIAVERVNLVKYNDRHHESIAKLRWSDRPPRTNHGINVDRARLWADGLHQPIEIPGMARMHDVSFQTMDHQPPAPLAGEVAALRLGEHTMKRLLIGLPSGLGAPCRLCEFLFQRDAREASLDSTNRIYVRDRHGT